MTWHCGFTNYDKASFFDREMFFKTCKKWTYITKTWLISYWIQIQCLVIILIKNLVNEQILCLLSFFKNLFTLLKVESRKSIVNSQNSKVKSALIFFKDKRYWYMYLDFTHMFLIRFQANFFLLVIILNLPLSKVESRKSKVKSRKSKVKNQKGPCRLPFF